MENQQNYQNAEEIEIYDYFQMIKKRKWQVVIIFLAAVLIAAALSFLMPKIYESSAIIKIGTVGTVPLQTTDEIIRISKDPDIVLKAISPNLLEIKTKGEDPRECVEKINQFITELLNHHQQILQGKTQLFQENINFLEEKKSRVENEIKDLENKIRLLGAPTSEAQAIIFQVYFNNLTASKNQLYQINQELITKNQEKISNYQPTKLETQPSLPTNPIKPNKKINVIIGAVLGLFLGIFYAFVAEYWEKNKSRLKS